MYVCIMYAHMYLTTINENRDDEFQKELGGSFEGNVPSLSSFHPPISSRLTPSHILRFPRSKLLCLLVLALFRSCVSSHIVVIMDEACLAFLTDTYQILADFLVFWLLQCF